MLLGLITDVHEEVGFLREALTALAARRVERIVFLGDVVGPCQQLPETCRCLRDAGVVGVYGNHDFGLCVEVEEEFRQLHGADVIGFMETLRPQMVLEDCFFQHVEPWLDPTKLEDLWYFEGMPERPEQLARIFTAVPQRVLFAGHFHRWLWARPGGVTAWRGLTPAWLDPRDRHFVAVGPLCLGEFATFDTETGWLTPASCLSAGMA